MSPPDKPRSPSQQALRAAEQLIDVQKTLLNKGLRALTPLSAFEEVFDQRVAAALQRLGYADPAEVARLREQVADLQRRLDLLDTPPAAAPAPTPASAPKRRRRTDS